MFNIIFYYAFSCHPDKRVSLLSGGSIFAAQSFSVQHLSFNERSKYKFVLPNIYKYYYA